MVAHHLSYVDWCLFSSFGHTNIEKLPCHLLLSLLTVVFSEKNCNINFSNVVNLFKAARENQTTDNLCMYKER